MDSGFVTGNLCSFARVFFSSSSLFHLPLRKRRKEKNASASTAPPPETRPTSSDLYTHDTYTHTTHSALDFFGVFALESKDFFENRNGSSGTDSRIQAWYSDAESERNDSTENSRWKRFHFTFGLRFFPTKKLKHLTDTHKPSSFAMRTYKKRTSLYALCVSRSKIHRTRRKSRSSRPGCGAEWRKITFQLSTQKIPKKRV